MPKPKHHEHERRSKHDEHERRSKHHEHERRSDRDREDSGDDPKRHAKIIERRSLGSPPPTLERYARALQQWHALPGAVMWPATDVKLDPEARASAGASHAPVGAGGEETER